MAWESRSPDGIASALEQRAEIDSLDTLHALRRALVTTYAPLKALHGHEGIWDAKRKAMLEAYKVKARIDMQEAGLKITEGAVDSMAYAEPGYEKFLDQGIADRIAYVQAQIEMDEYAERIRNREFCLMAYSSEARLAR